MRSEAVPNVVKTGRVLGIAHSPVKLDGKPGQRSLAVSKRYRAFLADVVQGRVAQFQQRTVTGERAWVLGCFAQIHVHRFDGIVEASKSIHTGEEEVLHAAVERIMRYAVKLAQSRPKTW